VKSKVKIPPRTKVETPAEVQTLRLSTTTVRVSGADCNSCGEPMSLGSKAVVVNGRLVHSHVACVPR